MFGFKSVMSKIGKAIESQAKLSNDLRLSRSATFGDSLMFGESARKQRRASASSRARRVLSSACRAGQSTGKVVLEYADAIAVLALIESADQGDDS